MNAEVFVASETVIAVEASEAADTFEMAYPSDMVSIPETTEMENTYEKQPAEISCNSELGYIALCASCPLLRMFGDCPKEIRANLEETDNNLADDLVEDFSENFPKTIADVLVTEPILKVELPAKKPEPLVKPSSPKDTQAAVVSVEPEVAFTPKLKPNSNFKPELNFKPRLGVRLKPALNFESKPKLKPKSEPKLKSNYKPEQLFEVKKSSEIIIEQAVPKRSFKDLLFDDSIELVSAFTEVLPPQKVQEAVAEKTSFADENHKPQADTEQPQDFTKSFAESHITSPPKPKSKVYTFDYTKKDIARKEDSSKRSAPLPMPVVESLPRPKPESESGPKLEAELGLWPETELELYQKLALELKPKLEPKPEPESELEQALELEQDLSSSIQVGSTFLAEINHFDKSSKGTIRALEQSIIIEQEAEDSLPLNPERVIYLAGRSRMAAKAIYIILGMLTVPRVVKINAD